MFYKLNKQGQIETASEVKRDDTWLETDKEIVRGYDGALYFKGEEPEQDIEVLKLNKISESKTNCQNYILSVYPSYKQNNVSNFTIKNPIGNDLKEDKTNIEVLIEMTDFINMQRQINHDYEDQIINCQNKAELDEIIIKYGKNN